MSTVEEVINRARIFALAANHPEIVAKIDKLLADGVDPDRIKNGMIRSAVVDHSQPLDIQLYAEVLREGVIAYVDMKSAKQENT